MNTTIFRIKINAAIAVVLFFSVSIKAATLFEDFNSPSALLSSEGTNSSLTDITYSTGVWKCLVNSMTDVDHYNGVGGIKLRGLTGKNILEMRFDKQGAGVVSFLYGSFSSNSGGIIVLQKSTDQGANWTNVGDPVTVPTWNGTFYLYSQQVNIQGGVRFRIFTTVTSNANTRVNVDDFMITDYNADQVVMPVSSLPTGVYQTPQTVTLSSATAGATIYYTTDGTAPTTASSVYSTPLNITTTTKIRTYAVAAGNVDSRENTIIVNIPIAVNSISEYYTLMPTSGSNLQYYKYTGEATVSFVYWASNTNTAKKIVLQDNTGGVIIDDNYKFLSGNYAIGDKVTAFIAQVVNTNDAPMLYPYADFTVVSNNNAIDAKVITLADVPTNTYQLVQFNDLYFDAANETEKFGVYSFRVIHDASTPSTSSIVYNTPNLIAQTPNYISTNTVLPAKTNLIALVMRNNPLNSGINNNNPYYYIFPRMLSDIDVPFKSTASVNPLKLYNLSVTGSTVNFETFAPETVKVFSANGQVVKSIISVVGKNSLELSKGVYIIRIGDKTAKVLL